MNFHTSFSTRQRTTFLSELATGRGLQRVRINRNRFIRGCARAGAAVCSAMGARVKRHCWSRASSLPRGLQRASLGRERYSLQLQVVCERESAGAGAEAGEMMAGAQEVLSPRKRKAATRQERRQASRPGPYQRGQCRAGLDRKRKRTKEQTPTDVPSRKDKAARAVGP